MGFPILTIGHSNHAIDRFIALLKGAEVEALADIRSVPMSKFNPQFRQKDLKAAVEAAGIDYLYMGKALGGHPRAPEPEFREGLAKLIEAAQQKRIAIMCAEKEPLNCHRTLLVARVLAAQDIPVEHILADGSLQNHHALENELLNWTGVKEDLFTAREERVEIAYEKRKAKGDFKRKSA
jgi:uncharacterized protein (DUF488 family)